ncbi:carbohydrate ABC transporter permease [Streptomyces sp. NBRC 109706]|uniref:carbohydrate ABC transporter permease n=1 Tax=Streptomyces sp. NBRC 109706 TaxID=1550035 RepID=UPI000782A343|nr:carbohydrate ABC transporter permease [Streptomyces sp. NBRC 109706]
MSGTTATVRGGRRRAREGSSWWARTLSRVMVTAAVVYFVGPVAWLFIASTKSAGDLYSTPGFAFADWRLWENIEALFAYRSGIFSRWLLNSLVYSVFGALLTVLVCALCGYALALYEFRGRRLLMGALLASLLIPATVVAQPIFLLLVWLGLNNTMAGVVLPSLVYPFGVMLCYVTARASVPDEIVEAARLDGAGEFRIFFTIAVHLMRTGLTTVLLFAFTASWNSFLLPLLVLDDERLFPVTLGLVDWSQQSASVAQLGTLTIVGAFVSVFPVVLVFVLLQRYWRSGVSAGSLKM